tara:strand:+ start:228 stop:380 length:153 start_codon:yes stop_codon:yes gene_type:complete
MGMNAIRYLPHLTIFIATVIMKNRKRERVTNKKIGKQKDKLRKKWKDENI